MQLQDGRYKRRQAQVQAQAQAQAQAQSQAQALPARVAGHLGIVRIAQSVTPVTVIHSTASAQSRVATLHLFAHELLAFLVVPLAIAMSAPHGMGGRGKICCGPDVRIANRRDGGLAKRFSV